MSDDKLQQAIESFDVAAFASRYGGQKESQSPHSHEWLFTCSCGSSRLRYNRMKHGWRCWACYAHGDTYTLVRTVAKLTDLQTITFFIDGYVGGDAHTGPLASALAPEKKVHTNLRRLPPAPWPEGAEILTTPCAPHADAWRYLVLKRHFTVEMVQEFRLAYGRAGRTKDRIIFPCYMDGTFVFWQARAIWDPPEHLSKDDVRKWKEETGYIKSINPIVAKEDDVAAHEVLFNYERARVESHVVICEGPIDAIKVGPHAVALLGKTTGQTKVARLRRTRALRFTIYLDAGEEETKASHALAGELAGFGEVFIATPPTGYDAGALDRAQNAAIIAAAVPYRPGLR